MRKVFVFLMIMSFYMTSSVANSSDDYASIRSRMYQMDVDSVEVCYSIPQWGWIGLVAEFNHKGANFYIESPNGGNLVRRSVNLPENIYNYLLIRIDSLFMSKRSPEIYSVANSQMEDDGPLLYIYRYKKRQCTEKICYRVGNVHTYDGKHLKYRDKRNDDISFCEYIQLAEYLVASHAGHEYYEIYRKNHANTDRLIPNQFLNNCDETAATDNNFGAQEKIYEVVPYMPSFPGGQKLLEEYLKNNINAYDCPEGKVVVSFVVEKSGDLTNLSVVQSNQLELNEKALDIIQGMPKWNPGYMNGNKVRVRCHVCIEKVKN